MSFWLLNRMLEDRRAAEQRQREEERQRRIRQRKKREEDKKRALELDKIRDAAGIIDYFGTSNNETELSEKYSFRAKIEKDPKSALGTALTRGFGAGPEVATGFKHQNQPMVQQPNGGSRIPNQTSNTQAKPTPPDNSQLSKLRRPF